MSWPVCCVRRVYVSRYHTNHTSHDATTDMGQGPWRSDRDGPNSIGVMAFVIRETQLARPPRSLYVVYVLAPPTSVSSAGSAELTAHTTRYSTHTTVDSRAPTAVPRHNTPLTGRRVRSAHHNESRNSKAPALIFRALFESCLPCTSVSVC